MSEELSRDVLSRARAIARAYARRGRRNVHDCLSDAGEASWKAVKSYDPSKCCSLLSWVSQRVRWALIDGERKRIGRGRKLQPLDDAATLSADLPAPDGTRLADELTAPEGPDRLAEEDAFEAWLRPLSEAQAEALRLHFLEGLSHAEAGERAGVGASTLAMRVKAGLDRLREIHTKRAS